MQFFISAFLFALAVSVTDASRRMIPRSISFLSDQFIDEINRLNSTWTAGRNFDECHPPKELKRLMGTFQNSTLGESKLPLLWHDEIENLPAEFDAREQWPGCSTVRQIRDQGSCGSCWIFGAVEAMSDRVCIHSGGMLDIELSAQDLMSCCRECNGGCDGGSPIVAWRYYRDHGLVTGGPYGSFKGCMPYRIAHCRYCGDQPTPACTNQCDNPFYNVPYFKDKHYAKKVYSVHYDERHIMTEIMNNGPVEADFTVYSDFYHYRSGVYQRHSEQVEGGHAVRVLGWGTENGVKYWLCANSWNSRWGALGGFFKILRGVNECGIESTVYAGIPA